jgi:hypothetical protein
VELKIAMMPYSAVSAVSQFQEQSVLTVIVKYQKMHHFVSIVDMH